MTAAAQTDLAAIWAYVAGETTETTATRLIDTIMNACKPLRELPLAGASREAFASGLRVGFAGSYAIYYVHDDRELVIVRVLHGARDAAALAAHGGFDHETMIQSRRSFASSSPNVPPAYIRPTSCAAWSSTRFIADRAPAVSR